MYHVFLTQLRLRAVWPVKYVYGEGLIGRSPRNPKVQSGELPRRTITIVREEWTPWRYWVYRLSSSWVHALMRRTPVRWVPPLREWIDRVWCQDIEIRLYRPNDRTTIPIREDQARPDRRARNREWMSDNYPYEARPPDPRSNW